MRIQKTFILSVVILFNIFISHEAGALTSQEANQKYQQALHLAKTGKADQALPALLDLVNKFPQIKRYHYDYILVLLWAGENQEVIKRSHKIDLSLAPDYVLESVARAARNLQQFTQSEKTFRQLLVRQPASVKYQLGLISVLIDQQHMTSAWPLLEKLAITHPDNIDVLLLRAYAKEADGDYLAASMIYEYILHLQADQQSAVRGLVFALSANKSFIQGYEKAKQNRELFSDEEWIKLNWDLAATYIRWGEIPSKLIENRYDETDYAIGLIENNLKLIETLQSPNQKLWKSRARFDLLVALRDRKRMQEVINNYDILISEGIDLPVYAKIAVADAFLYLQFPERAQVLYLQVLEEIPHSYNANQSLVYAYVESEQLDLANELAIQLAKQQPDKLHFKSPKGKGILYSRGNPRKTETELAVVVITAFSDRLNDAYQQVEQLYKKAPFNTEIRNARANIYYYRGWPRQAKQEFISALNIEPKHLGLRTGMSNVFHDLREYREEELNTETLYQQYPEDKGVQQQKRLLGIHNERELKVFTNGGMSTGSAQGSESVSLDSYLFSQPLDYNYRIFTHFRWQTGVFSDYLDKDKSVRGYSRRYGMGLEYAITDLLATAEVHYDNFEHNTLGFRGSLNYQFNDYLSAGISFDSRSDEIGLRALTNGAGVSSGVTAKSVDATISYRMHESRQFDLNHQFFDYSDGNERIAFSGTYFERWISGPIYKFATFINTGMSINTNMEGNYYHPKNDYNLSVTLDNDFLTYRFYDLSFHQRVAFTLGNYWQKEKDNGENIYHSDLIGNIQYEHRWKARDRYELVYGGVRGYHIYDGDREESWRFYLNLNVRF